MVLTQAEGEAVLRDALRPRRRRRATRPLSMEFRQGCVLWLLLLLWAQADEVPGRCLVQDLNWDRVAQGDSLVPGHCEGVDLSWTKVKQKPRRAL